MNQQFPTYLSLDDVLLIPNQSSIDSRSQVDLSWELCGHKLTTPIIAINMDSVTSTEMAISMGKNGSFGILPRFDTPEIQAKKVSQIKAAGFLTAAAIGINDHDWNRLEILLAAGADHISIDIAHGHMSRNLEFIKKIRAKFPKLSLSAGVVGTYQGALDIFHSGADIVRVGVGPGSICTTRIQTGCGVPQFTAITEASRAARETKKLIWADGGIKNSGDITKCLAAGASAVIVGSLLAGTNEAPSQMVEVDGVKYKRYNASTCAIEKQKQIQNNAKDKSLSYLTHIEGVESLVPYSGSVNQVLESLLAGVRSGYSYCGALNTSQIWQKANFCQVTTVGFRENGHHDVLLKA